jgi:hypothetical protein
LRRAAIVTNANIGHNGGPDIEEGRQVTLRTLWAKHLFANPNTPVYVMAIAWAIHWFSKSDGTGAALSNEQLETICGISYDTAIKGKRWLRDNGYVEIKLGTHYEKTKFRMVIPVAAATVDAKEQARGLPQRPLEGSVPATPDPARGLPQRPQGSAPATPRGLPQRPYIQERDSRKIQEREERAGARGRQERSFWEQAFARDDNDPYSGVVFDKGKLTLLNGTKAYWLDKLGSEDRLDLALVEIAPALQPNGRVPLQAQVEQRLAKIAAERKDRDERYARAAQVKAASKKPFRPSRW